MLLVLNFYAASMDKLKAFNMAMQKTEPKIHQLHAEQEKLTGEFFCCFLDSACLKGLSARKLLTVNVQSNLLKTSEMYIGPATRDILAHVTEKDTRDSFWGW